jgi:hypothetical protein
MSTLPPEENERVKDETCYKETKILRVMRKIDAGFFVPIMQWGKGFTDQ